MIYHSHLKSKLYKKLTFILFVIMMFSVGLFTACEDKLSEPEQNIGSLKISSTPTGASIIFDGEESGETTPHTYTDVEEGFHTVELILEGYEAWGPTSIQIESDKQFEIDAQLIHFTGLILLPDADYANLPIGTPFGGTGDLPNSYDLSTSFPTPRSQGSQGSCVGWAVGYAMKTYHEKVERNWSLTTDSHLMSPAFIYNQIKVGGCNGGSFINSALNLLQTQGISSLATMPYNSSDCSAVPTNAAFTEAADYTIDRWSRINHGSNPDLKGYIANDKQPIIVGIEVHPDFYLNSTNTIYDDDSGDLYGYHAIVLVGYDDSRNGFKFINSWGTSYGENGFGWIAYDIVSSIVTRAYVAYDNLPDVPTLSYSPSSFNFGSAGTSGFFNITNFGDGTLSWTLSDNATWMSLSTTSGATTIESDQVTININRVGLAPGSYEGTITITSNGGSGQISVSIEVASEPILAVSPPVGFDFGLSGNSGTISISNLGSGTLTWTISDNRTWMSLSRSSGTTTTETDNVVLTIDRTGLNDGNHTGSITISSNGGSTILSVSIDVSSGPALEFTPTLLNYGTSSSVKTFFISNAGSGTLTYTISDNRSWISVNPTSGTATTESDGIQVDVSRTGLSTGSHSGTISITSNGGDGDVSISMEVATGIIIEISPASQDFGSVEVGESIDKTFSIRNSSSSNSTLTGNVSLSSSHFSIISGGGSFSLSPGQSKNVTIRFTPTSTGAKSANISITHNATNVSSPATIPISGTGTATPIPDLEILELIIDDDNSGGSNGNGNGKAEVGETIEVNIRIRNNGPGDASGIEAFALVASSDLDEVNVIDGSFLVSSLSEGATVTDGDFDFEIHTMPTGDDIDLDIRLDFVYGPTNKSTSVTLSVPSIDVFPGETDITITAHEDAFVHTYDIDENTGDGVILATGYDHGLSSANRALIDFATNNIPSGANIVGATLYVYGGAGDGEPFDFYIAWLIENWSESTVTWRNQPVGRYFTSRTFTFSSSDGWQNFDVTSELIGLLGESSVLHEGFLLLATSESGTSNHYKLIWSTESASGRKPYLVVTYTTSQSANTRHFIRETPRRTVKP